LRKFIQNIPVFAKVIIDINIKFHVLGYNIISSLLFSPLRPAKDSLLPNKCFALEIVFIFPHLEHMFSALGLVFSVLELMFSALEQHL